MPLDYPITVKRDGVGERFVAVDQPRGAIRCRPGRCRQQRDRDRRVSRSVMCPREAIDGPPDGRLKFDAVGLAG